MHAPKGWYPLTRWQRIPPFTLSLDVSPSEACRAVYCLLYCTVYCLRMNGCSYEDKHMVETADDTVIHGLLWDENESVGKSLLIGVGIVFSGLKANDEAKDCSRACPLSAATAVKRLSVSNIIIPWDYYWHPEEKSALKWTLNKGCFTVYRFLKIAHIFEMTECIE